MSILRSTFRGAPGLILIILSISPLHANIGRDFGKAGKAAKQGEWITENSVLLEHDRDHQDTVWTLETALQYAPVWLPNTTLLLESGWYQWHRPKEGERISGNGDLDFTALYQLFAPPETASHRPAIALGGRIKFPTAGNREIGTGKFDYTGLVVIGRELGDFEINLELEYTIYGQLDGAGGPDPDAPERRKNQLFYTLALDYDMTEHFKVFVELYGETSPIAGEAGGTGLLVGIEYDIDLSAKANLFTQLSADTDNQFSLKIGVEWKW
jgi:hypothetical protein